MRAGERWCIRSHQKSTFSGVRFSTTEGPEELQLHRNIPLATFTVTVALLLLNLIEGLVIRPTVCSPALPQFRV